MGEYARAIDYADRLLIDARGRGLDRGVGLWCLAPKALSEFWLGRWDDALATIARQGDYAWGIDAAVYLRSIAAQIAAGRDDLVRARALAEEAIEIARTGFPEQAMAARVAAAWVELFDNRPAVALDHIRAVWAVARTWEGLVMRSQVLWVGSWAAADLASRSPAARELGAELAVATAESIRELAARTTEAMTGPGLVLELAAAEARRLDLRDEPAVG
jgi:hypothetical protein